MCHITGGGNVDLQPVVEAVLNSPDFGKHWKQVKAVSNGDMASSEFRNREDPKLSIVISRAKRAGDRLDRVQVVGTAAYSTAE